MKMKICIYFFLLALIFLSGCKKVIHEEKMPDIKNISVSELIKFDMRVLKKSYGMPPISDLTDKKVCYYNVYYEYRGLFSFDLRPFSSETWYLVLSPTKDENYYYGLRYMDPYFSVEKNNKEKFKKVEPLTDISTIEKLMQIGPDNIPINSK